MSRNLWLFALEEGEEDIGHFDRLFGIMATGGAGDAHGMLGGDQT